MSAEHAGRVATAPCGHAGQIVIGTYVECLKGGCDGVPYEIDPEATPRIVVSERCPFCGSHDTEPFTTYYYGVQSDAFHCVDCGRVFTP